MRLNVVAWLSKSNDIRRAFIGLLLKVCEKHGKINGSAKEIKIIEITISEDDYK